MLRTITLTLIAGGGVGQDKSTGDEEYIGLLMQGFVVGLKFKVVDEKFMAEIVWKWGWIIMGSGPCIL